jgi:phosphoribosyl-AMP cyclohydrolase / phosphoribosyl-ATP pyrophosphohydrolase
MATDEGFRFGTDGLLPVVVQDSADGRVLMLSYMNAEALARTEESGEAHFWARDRQTLWRKGETSGNVLRLVSLTADCDRDTLLATVVPAGPTCHTGARSCFDTHGIVAAGSSGAATLQGFGWLETLWSTICDRVAHRPEGSYTASLLASGVDGVSRKVAEEALEVLLAAKNDSVAEKTGTDRNAPREALAGELADLIYHALVLLAERGLPPSAVISCMRDRHRG